VAKVQYDFIVAQMAATIASGLVRSIPLALTGEYSADVSRLSVALARAIVAEVERTQPEEKA
jgi:hypothetical protein